MHITARNYAAQSSKALRHHASEARKLTKDSTALDEAMRLDSIADDIDNAVHFAMPDGGKIFNDRLKGIEGKSIRPPFPIMTVEWHMPGDGAICDGQFLPIEKRLVLIREIKSYRNTGMEGVFFVALDFRSNMWHVMPVYIFVPFDLSVPDQKQFPDGCVGLECEVGVHLPLIFNAMYGIDPKSGVIPDGPKNDVLTDVLCTMELFEALTCSNVSHEPMETIDPRKNAKRIKAGKLPIHETRILTIDSGKSSQSGMAQGGTHASPRQHLRRGHIRRLPDKNVWVNSCVVGRAEHGVIEKQYHVQ